MIRLLTVVALVGIGFPVRADVPEELLDPGLSKWVAVAKPPATAKEVQASWSLADGVLRCTGKPTGCLLTKADITNATLSLEFRYPPSAAKRLNSGLLIHCQPGDLFWPHSYEVQLAQGQVGDLWSQPDADKRLPASQLPPSQLDPKSNGRHHFRLAGVVEKAYPEWNRVEVVARGAGLEVRVNGALANRATGLGLTRGRIGLQAEGVAVEFRKLIVVSHSGSGG